jgi:hypothetical protein
MIRLASQALPASAAAPAASPAPASAPPPGRVPVEPWAGWDVLMALTVATLCYSIVEVPGIPVSPTVWLPFIFAFSARHELRRRGRALVRHPVFALMALTLGALVVVRAVFTESTFEAIADAGRVMSSGFAMGALALYASSTPGRFRRAALTLMVVMAVSLAWFLLELTVVQPFVNWRFALYADLYDQDTTGFVERVRTGLVPYLHLLGYQLAAFVPLALVPLVERRRRRSQQLLGGGGILLAFMALFISSQRSALLSIVLSLGMVLFFTGGLKMALRMALLSLVVVVGADALVRRDMWVRADVGSNQLFEKLVSEEASRDAEFRGRMQVRGLELAFIHPLGLRVAGLSWKEIGFMHVHSRMEQAPRYAVGAIAIHNGYLGTVVEYGLAFLLLVGALLVSIGRMVLRVMRQRAVLHPDLQLWTVGVTAAVAGLYIFQAGTHNASFLTLEPASILALGLLLALDLMRRAAVRAQVLPAPVPVSPRPGVTR